MGGWRCVLWIGQAHRGTGRASVVRRAMARHWRLPSVWDGGGFGGMPRGGRIPAPCLTSPWYEEGACAMALPAPRPAHATGTVPASASYVARA